MQQFHLGDDGVKETVRAVGKEKNDVYQRLLFSVTRDNSQHYPSCHAAKVYLSFASLLLSISLDMRLEQQTSFIIETRQPSFVSAEMWKALSEC